MAFIRGFIFTLSALFVLLCSVACSADTSCDYDEVEEEMRLAQQRGSQWLQDKREEANLAAVKASSLIQTAARTQQKIVNTFAPDGKVVKRTVGVLKASSKSEKKKNKKELQKPTFNPFLPNEVAR